MGATTGRDDRAVRRRAQAVVAVLVLVAGVLAVALPSGAEEATDEAGSTGAGSPATSTTFPVDLTDPDAGPPPSTSSTTPTTTSTTAVDASDPDALGEVAPPSDPSEPGPAEAAAATPAGPSALPAVPSAPSLTASPSTGLVQGDVVTLTGTGFPAGDPIGIVQCKLVTDGPVGCNLSTIAYTAADASGSFTATFVPRRILVVDGTSVDCADADACKIGAGSVADQTQGADAPIRFDPSVAPPPPPSITITPDTDLLDGQTVTVSGIDYQPNSSFGVIQCVEPPESDGSNCAFDTLTFASTDATGSFTTTVRVQRLITVGGVTTDCADPGACVIGAGPGPSGQGDTAPIRFDPSVPPPPPPSITVSPDTDLLERQVVDVTGSGFTPGRTVIVTQCLASLASGACAPILGPATQADGSGSIATTIELRRVLRTPVGTADCADPSACVVAAGTTGPQAVAAIAFDPSVPPPPPPSIALTPGTDLLDGQTVHVTGSGFEPDGFVSLAQCPTAALDPTFGCPFGGGTGARTDADGGFELDIVVDRVLYGPGGSAVDCADVDACVLVAYDFRTIGLTTQAPLAFDPTGPLPPPPSVAVTPDTDLADGQIVQVTGTGYPRQRTVAVVQCRADLDGAPGCDLGTAVYVAPGADRVVDVDLVVQRYIDVDTGTVDCAVPGACVVAAGTMPDGPGDTAPIVFDPDAPPAPGPTLTVGPASGIEDGQTVTVTGHGFPRGSTVAVVQCRTDAVDAPGCDAQSFRYVQVGQDRSFSTPFKVVRTIRTASGPVDCSVPGSCVVGAGALPSGHQVHADVPIVVDGGLLADDPPGPEVAGAEVDAATPTEVAPRFTG